MICDARTSLVALSGAGVIFVDGYGYDKTIIQKMNEVSGLPATTTSSSVIEALKALSHEGVYCYALPGRGVTHSLKIC